MFGAHLTKPQKTRSRAPPRRHPLMGSLGRVCRSWEAQQPGARRIPTPTTLSRYPSAPRIPWRWGAPSQFADCDFRQPERPPENEIRTDFCTERRVKLQFQGVGALPWLPGRRNGLARRIYHRVAADGRFPMKQILTEARYSLSTLSSASWYSAFHVVPGANPAKLHGWAGRWRRPDVCAGNLSPRSLSDSGNSA